MTVKPIQKPKKRKRGISASKELDILWSKAVKLPGRCTRCLTTQDLQAAHIIRRTYRATRWLLTNGTCLCKGCHVYFTHRELEWQEWVTAQFGPSHYADLRRLALTYEKADKKVLLAELRAALKEDT